ncbi:MAG: PDC sensor domain-containing protein [Burkholderiaceae bacterium]
MSFKGYLAASLLVLAGLGTTHAADLSADLQQRIDALRETWANSATLINAIKEQNARNIPLSDIQEIDRKWMATSGLAAFMMPVLDNPAVAELLRLEKATGHVQESFVMDNQGALVAATNKTSDYWQGDEAKFTESFKNGQGAVHVGKVDFDKSAQAYLVQVSIPVMDDGRAIGAITIGIDLGDSR